MQKHVFFINCLVRENPNTTKEQWDVYSIDFLIHLSEFNRDLNNMNISLIVDFAYKWKGGEIISPPHVFIQYDLFGTVADVAHTSISFSFQLIYTKLKIIYQYVSKKFALNLDNNFLKPFIAVTYSQGYYIFLKNHSSHITVHPHS